MLKVSLARCLMLTAPVVFGLILPGARSSALAGDDKPVMRLAAADAPTGKTAGAQPSAENAKAKKTKKAGGRLPAFYADVVDGEQRQKIYAIQQEYAPKVAELKAHLAATVKDLNEKIDAVLTPEQRQRIEQLKAAPNAQRQRNRPADK